MKSDPPAGCGVLYVATGARHVAEMVASARSVRRHMPGLPITVYTDQTGLPDDAFDEVRTLRNPQHGFIDKIAPLCETPFERTLFLDTDTLLAGPVPDLFQLLDRVELAAAHAPLRHDRPFRAPNCFAELNTGVLAYRRNAATVALFRDWLRLYEEECAATGKRDSDQPAFREALYRSSVSFSVLPPEYNLRTVMPAAVGRGRVRIVHGRAPDMDRVLRWVNESAQIRIFLPTELDLAPEHFHVLSPRGRVVAGIVHAAVAPLRLAERTLRAIKRGLHLGR